LLITYNNHGLEFEKINDEGKVILNPFENQDGMSIELYKGSFLDILHIHDVAIAFEYVDSFDLEPDETEQGTTINNRGKSCLLDNFQERVAVCVLQDPFSFWLESSRKVNLVVFLDQGYQFQHKLELFFQKSLYLSC
jgi:hypothetical protein